MNAPDPTDAQGSYSQILAYLRRLRQRAAALEGAAALLYALGLGVLGLGLVWVLLEAWLYLSPAWRSGLGLAALLTVVTYLAYALRRRLPPVWALTRLGLRVERSHPPLAERLISTLELWDNPRARRLYSPGLLAATVDQTAALLARLDPSRIAPARALWPPARNCGLTVLAALALFALGGPTFTDALQRCLHPTTAFARAALTRIQVTPGDVEIVKGEDAPLALHFGGRLPTTATVLHRQDEAQPWRREEIIVGEADSIGYVFKQVKHAFSYRIEAGDGTTPTYRVSVVDPPAIQRLRLEYHYPAYSRLERRVEEESGDISALVGTQVHFTVFSSKPLATAELVFNDTLQLHARIEGDRALVSLTVAQAGFYYLRLHDLKGIANRDPIRYTVQPVTDSPPRVEFTVPGRDMDLPETRRVLLAVEAADDFGIERLELVYRVNDGPPRRRPLPFAPNPTTSSPTSPTAAAALSWDLGDLELLPEDRVFYLAEAFDNNAVSGPNKGVSREYSLRFPSLRALYEEIDSAQEDRIDALEELVEEGERSRQQIETARRQLLRQEKMSWEQKQELESALQSEAERLQEMDELANQLEETIQKLEENDLASDEILEKLQTIRELMDQVITPELQEALAQLQEAMEDLDPEKLAEALKQFAEDQAAFQERLDRTIALLEQIQAEQRLEAAVEQAADLENRQANINDSIDPASEATDPRLEAQEQALAQDTEQLAQELEALAQDMAPIDPQTAAELAAQAAAMDQQQLEQRMQEMAAQLKAGQRSQARNQGQMLQRDLKQTAAQLQELQEEFSERQKQELSAEMRQAMRDLVGLSQSQEQLHQRTDADPAAPQDLALEQFALLEGTGQVTERVAQVARRTMSLEHGLAPTLGHALKQMQEAAGRLGQRHAVPAAQAQQEAMGYLNEAVLQMRQSLENLSQSQMPSGFAEAMQRMAGMAQQQGDLNGMTQQGLQAQRSGQRGSGTLDPRRLAAEQRRIYQALEQLQRELRGHRGAQKRMEAIQEDMRSVLKDLDRRRLDDGLVERQRRIFQRMLDASRSIHTRGHKQKRESTTGQAQPYTGPAQLPADLGQARDALREAMKNALESPYPEAYRALIRQYYELVYQDLIDRQLQAPAPGTAP